MARYEFDPSKVAATIEVFPKGDYEFQVGEPKSFIRKNKKNEDSFGIRFPVTIMEDISHGKSKGKRTVVTGYQQSEGAQAMTKQFVMAVLGYANNQTEEKRFDAEQAGKDWGFDPETGAVGDAWRQATGKRVIGQLDEGKNEETGDPQQKFVKWIPIGLYKGGQEHQREAVGAGR